MYPENGHEERRVQSKRHFPQTSFSVKLLLPPQDMFLNIFVSFYHNPKSNELILMNFDVGIGPYHRKK